MRPVIDALLGTSWPVFLGLTLFVFGAGAWMTGRAVAGNWQPRWLLWPYALLLTLADRFFDYALFGGSFVSPMGFLAAGVTLMGLAQLAFRLTRVSQMCRQYPWLYERDGLLGYRDRPTVV